MKKKKKKKKRKKFLPRENLLCNGSESRLTEDEEKRHIYEHIHIHEETIQQHRRRIYATARIEGSRLPLKVFVYVPDPLYPTLN